MQRNQPNQFVDPDPTTIAVISMTAAALVLQFVQTWKAFFPSAPPSRPGIETSRTANLGHLEQSVAKLQGDLRQLHRIIERGSSSSDREFFDASYRIATTSLNLDNASHAQIQNQLGTSFGDLGNLSIWVNHIIREDPQLAARIGSRISGGLESTAQTLNTVLENGGPNRIIISEARNALEQLAKAIDDELSGGN